MSLSLSLLSVEYVPIGLAGGEGGKKPTDWGHCLQQKCQGDIKQ